MTGGRTAGVGCGRLGQDQVLVERLLDQVTGGGSGYRRLPGHYIYPGGCGRAAGPDFSGAVRSAGGAAQRPAPAAADHVGLQGPDLHGARLLCRSAAGERPPDRVGPGLSAVRRGGGRGPDGPGAGGDPGPPVRGSGLGGGLCRPGGHHGRRAGRQPPGADRAGRVRPHPEPPGPGGLAGRPEPPVGAGWGHRRGGHPLGALLLADARRQGSAAWSCCSGRWNSPAGTACSARITAPVSPSPSRGCGPCWRRTAGTACTGPLPVEFPAAGRKKGVEDLEAAEQVKGLRTRCKKQMDKLFEDLGGDSGQLLADLALARPAVRGLMELTARFQEDYAREKARRGILDFFRPGTSGPAAAHPGQGRRARPAGPVLERPVRRGDGGRVSGHQPGAERHLHCRVRWGAEAVYGGRREAVHLPLPAGRPHHLPGQVPPFQTLGPGGGGEERTVVLTRNFRSRPEVLEGTNDLFQNIMSTEFGELDYTQDQALAPGAAFPPEGDWRVELDLEDLSFRGDQEEGERADKNLLEARWAARRIRELLDGELMLTEGAGSGGRSPLTCSFSCAPRGRCSTTISGPSTRQGCPGPPRGGGLLCLHRDQCGPVPSPDRGQSPPGCGADRGPALPGVRLFRRSAGSAPGGGGRGTSIPLWSRPPAGGPGVPGFPDGAGGAALRGRGPHLPPADLAHL